MSLFSEVPWVQLFNYLSSCSKTCKLKRQTICLSPIPNIPSGDRPGITTRDTPVQKGGHRQHGSLQSIAVLKKITEHALSVSWLKFSLIVWEWFYVALGFAFSSNVVCVCSPIVLFGVFSACRSSKVYDLFHLVLFLSFSVQADTIPLNIFFLNVSISNPLH